MANAPIGGGGGIPISPQGMIRQWQHAPHKFQVNVWNFEVKVGKAAQEIFRKSFDMKRFNDNSSIAWKPRSPKSKGTHPLMVQTASLKNSIKWKHMTERGQEGGVSIYTDPNGFGHTAAHRGFCYAQVHNDPNQSIRRGRVRNMPPRQFMGDSKVLDDELDKLSAMIFKGFPM